MTQHVLRTELELFRPPGDSPAVESENVDDVFVISTPLSRGSARLESNGRVMHDGDVRPGMLRVTSPGERVRLRRRVGSGGVVITVSGMWFREVAATQRYRGGFDDFGLVRPILEVDRNIERLRCSLLAIGDVDPAQRNLYVEGLALTLLSLVLNRRLSSVDSVAFGDGLSDQEFALCAEFADGQIGTPFNLDSWAQVLNMPTAEFVRRFQRTTHCTPYAWLMNWRIDRAKQLMSDPDRSLVQVSLELGFSSQSHFTEAFRRRVGMSPGRWRRSLSARSRS
jgi:AraC family transcriptional regulator